MQGDDASTLRWWDPKYSSEKARADACYRWLARIMQRQDLRRRVHLFNAQMYEDIPNLGLGPYQYSIYDLGTDRLRVNLVRAVTDTYVSIISRSKPRARALTRRGPWELKRKAKGLTRWLDGRTQELDLYREISTPCCRDSAVFGLGLAFVHRMYPAVKDLWDVGVKRVLPWELLVDDPESQNQRNMRTMAYRSWYDREILAADYPAKKDVIWNNTNRYGPEFTAFDWAVDTVSDLTTATHFWRLPSYPGAGDGLHVFAVPNNILVQEKYENDRFPIARLYRSRPSLGVWGVSIPHELRGRQTFINQSLYDIEECLQSYGKPRIIYQVGTLEPDMISDDTEGMVPYSGAVPPQLWAPSVVMPPELYQLLREQWQGGFEQIGISQQSGAANVPQGLSGSGASIRAWNEIQDGRMYEASDSFQEWHMQLDDLMIDEARAIAKEKADYASSWRGKTYVQIVRFRDVDPGKDQYYLALLPESRLSQSVSQRYAQLQELFNSKVISQEEFREKLEFPDLEEGDALANAPTELAEYILDRFLSAPDPRADGVWVEPDPAWPLQRLSDTLTLAIARSAVDEVPPEYVAILDRFVQKCDWWLTRAKAAAQAAAAPPVAPAQQAPAAMNGAPPQAAA